MASHMNTWSRETAKAGRHSRVSNTKPPACWALSHTSNAWGGSWLGGSNEPMLTATSANQKQRRQSQRMMMEQVFGNEKGLPKKAFEFWLPDLDSNQGPAD